MVRVRALGMTWQMWNYYLQILSSEASFYIVTGAVWDIYISVVASIFGIKSLDVIFMFAVVVTTKEK